MIRYLLLLLGVLASDVAEARTKGMGAGVILGEPIAGTLLYRWSDRQAVQFMTGWSFGQKRLHLGGDYLFIPTEIEADDNMGLRYPVYVGVGLRVRLMGEDTTAGRERGKVGLRFPFGIAVEPEELPLEVYFEMAPVWVMTPVSHGGFDGGIGLRVFL